MPNGQSAWEKAKRYGIDVTLLESNLQKSYTERARAFQKMLEFALTLREAGKKYYDKLRKAR